MSATLDPRNDDAENLLILVRQLREQGCGRACAKLAKWQGGMERGRGAERDNAIFYY